MYVLLSSPVYTIAATFKEKAEQNGMKNSIRELFIQGLTASQPSETIAILKSNQVLKAIVSSYGLQAEVKRGFSSLFYRLRDHFYAQLRWKVPEADGFLFEQVKYEGEEIIQFGLRWIDHNTFSIFDRKNKIILGKIGEKVQVDNVSFILTRTPKALCFKKKYCLVFTPWIRKAQELRKKFKITPHKTSNTIYDLTLSFKDRKQGVRILDAIMEEYRLFLKWEHDQTAKEQIAYLEQKQTQLYEKLGKLFDEHAVILSETINKEGFFSLEHEIKSYSETHARIANIDIELEKLHNAGAEQTELARKIRELGEERTLLQIALKEVVPTDLTCSNKWMSNVSPIVKDFASLEEAQDGRDCATGSLDLECARALYTNYAKQLDETQKRIKSLSQLVDTSALAPLLKDPFSQEIIANITLLSLKLQDQKYSSPKERLRWDEELQQQKKILAEHVNELIKVERINAAAWGKKMVELQRASLTCLDQQIDVLQDQSRSEIEKKSHALLEEKKILQMKMQQSKNLPERWKLEQWLQWKTDLSKEAMAILTELVESKMIGRQLFHIESKPLDASIASRLLDNSHLILLSLLCGLGFAVVYFAVIFATGIVKGLPLTPSALKVMGFPVSGKVIDPETFRNISFFLGSSPIISLLGGHGPNYSHCLAEQLASGGKKILLIDCSFGMCDQAEDLPGLKQWENEMPVRPRSNYFFVSSGGHSPLALEIFQSKRFVSFLETAQNFYDHILLWYMGNLTSANASGLLKISTKAVITITKEQREQLTPLLHWAYHEGNYRITFISASYEG